MNGTPFSGAALPGSFAVIARDWSPGDAVELELSLPVERIASHPRVTMNQGCVALRRGPVVYCLEGTDHPGVSLYDLVLPRDARIEAAHDQELLGGVTRLEAAGLRRARATELYSAVGDHAADAAVAERLTAVPYFAWANRNRGAMRVFIPEA